MIEILGGPGSTCCCKVNLTAVEKGQEVVETEVSVQKHENLTPDYIKMNRDGMVPTVLTDGMIFVESSVIMRYLDRKHPEPPLTPSDPLEAMRMDLLMKDLDDKYHNAIAFLSFSEGSRDSEGEITEKAKVRLKSFDKVPDPQRRAWRRRSIEKDLSSDEGRNACGLLETMIKDIDAALALGPFLAGQNYSLADAALTPYVHRLWVLGCDPLWTDISPRVGEWYESIKARHSFDAVFNRRAHETRQRQELKAEMFGVREIYGENEEAGTWTRFRQALDSIGSKPDDPAARLPARIWAPTATAA